MSRELTFGEYQDASKETAGGYAQPDIENQYTTLFTKEARAMFLALAINGEAGELGEKVKKYVREEDEQYLAEAVVELGDVMWYMAQFASLLDEELEDVADENLEKLLDRQERDVIFGEGDER